MVVVRRIALTAVMAAGLWTSTAAASPTLSVTELKTNGLSQPLGIGDGTPDFSWRLNGAGRAATQSAYEVRVAATEPQLASGPYLWESGKVASSKQSDVVYGGDPLPSRQPAVWQVRVWDAAGEASAWSDPVGFETALLQQSDWGSAKWIELAGRTNTQPVPIFARAFSVDGDKTVKRARLYMSGLGLFEAQLNGAKVTDEVLAPGNTNYQLSAEYRTYDVTDKLRDGANTIGVELGNGTANNTKTGVNAAVGRTNLYGWWTSSAVGTGTLLEDVPAGATNVRVSSVANYYVGGAINLDTGDGGDRLESRTITAVGTTPTNTSLALPAAAGDTNVKVTSVSGLAVGDTLRFGADTPTVTAVGTARTTTTLFAPAPAGATNVKLASVSGFATGNTIVVGGESRTVTTVGTQGRATTLAAGAGAGATNIRVASVTGLVAGAEITVGGVPATIVTVGTSGANGSGLTLAAPLASAAASGSPVRYGGTGVGFTPALEGAHAQAASVLNSGTGVTFTPALSRAYNSGAAITTPGTGITFTPALDSAHAEGATVTGSGNPLAALDASAGAMVTPRLIGRLEISYTDGSSETIVTNRDWRAAFGPTVTDNWYSGSDYDARREQAGWTLPGADLSDDATRRDGSSVGWRSAGIAPAPNLTTKLAARTAEPVKVQRTLTPVKLTNPQPGVWVFDFGQNFAGWPELRLPDGVPGGTVVKMLPAETLNADGTVNQASIAPDFRGRDVFATYAALGTPGGETWRPQFNYFAMQYLQVTGLPAGFTPTTDLIRGLQLFADVPRAGDVETSNARINRLHEMSVHSMESNTMSVFTDCPGREKLSYGADYVQPMGSLNVNFDYGAYLRNMQVQLVEGQSKAGPDAGNVALKTPVYDWGYSGQFGDEINWGSSIVQVPWLLHKLYGDTQTMREHFDAMKTYMDFVARRKATDYIVTALLADWVSSEQTSQQIFGTWGYYLSAKYMSEMATLIGRDADAATYGELAASIKSAFNNRFYNTTLRRYTADGNNGTTGATQAAQALALDAGLVPEGERGAVLQALVDNIYAYQPFGGGPHFSAGHVGLGPVVRSLLEGGRSDVLWDVLQENTQPSYGFMLQPTAAHPNGMTTMPERWNLGDSQNHVILLQIEEWFHTGVAGIKQAPSSVAYRELIYKPTPVGDLTHANGHYTTPQGTARSEWRRDATGITRYDVTVPVNTKATVYVPATSAAQTFVATGSGDARYLRYEDGYQVYDVAAGEVTFLQGVSVPGGVGGTVPATLSLSLGAPASFGAFTPGVDRTYDASTTATVTSTAGDATLSVTDPSSTAPGRLVNGSFSLSEPLRARANASAFEPLSGSPTTLLTYAAPVSNDAVTVGFRQHIGASQPLRTGSYAKTLTFTLSTTNP